MSLKLDIYEKLGIFYLGKETSYEDFSLTDNLFLYKSKNLTTHAVIIGMTGSGKTGLGIDIIEEATIDKIPSIIIDPKGDMGNLLLTFPDLKPEDFKPWIDESEALNKGMSPDEYAKKVAQTWQKGIEAWHQDKSRIKKLKESADFTIYTPGSRAGIPLSVLSSFETPSKEILSDPDAFSSHITSAVSSLLALVGVDADPISSKEFMLLASIFSHFWKEGKDLSLEEIIGYIINPPFKKIGVLPIKSFYPQSERFKLATLFNNIISNPTFSVWSEGERLDIGKLLYTKEAKPKVSILSIAHLNDRERMFFVTLFLNRYIDWMRKQRGTSSLRTILYMDEIFGFFPSTSNPPSKEPMLLLLKQARAYGVGVVLATQNPIDLDYKGLSNIGSWFIGRLQTKRDKERVMEGLVSGGEGSLDKKSIEEILSSLKSRTFLFKSAKEDGLNLFQTRWVLSYLRGPITLEEIKRLMADKKNQTTKEEKIEESPKTKENLLKTPPYIGEDIENYFLNPPFLTKSKTRFDPYLVLEATVRFYNQKRAIDMEKEERVSLYLREDLQELDFKEAKEEETDKKECDKTPVKNALFSPIPSFLSSFSKKDILKAFNNFLYHNRKITLYRVPKLKMESKIGESPEEFKIRVQERLKELYEEEIEKLKERFEKERDKLERKLQRAQMRLEKEQEEASSKTTETILGFGMTLLDAFLGRKTIKRSTASKAASSLRSAGRVLKERGDVERAKEAVESVLRDLESLEERLQEEIEELSTKYDLQNYEIEEFYIKPRRSDIYNQELYLCWKPESI